jgi:hypothetical protein
MVGTTLHSLTLSVEGEVLSETLISTYRNTRRHISQSMNLYIRQRKPSANFWCFSYVTAFIFSISHRYLFRKCTGLLFRICLQLFLAANFAAIDVHRIALEMKAEVHTKCALFYAIFRFDCLQT